MAGPSTFLRMPTLKTLLSGIGFLLLYDGPLDIVLPISFSIFKSRHLLAAILDPNAVLTPLRLVGVLILGFLVLQLGRAAWPRADTPRWAGPGKVLLFPCTTTHSRMFPEKNSFSYSYLVVGIPVGWEGNAGGMVSVGGQGSPASKGWYHVNAADYLERGSGHLGLRGKLDKYLRSQVSIYLA